jgi:hypothetical protein
MSARDPLVWTEYQGQATASLEVEPAPTPSPLPSERRLTEDEVGRLYQAAHDRHQMRWFCEAVRPVVDDLVPEVLGRSAFPSTVRAIFRKAGVLS